jgi:hypothetical protein
VIDTSIGFFNDSIDSWIVALALLLARSYASLQLSLSIVCIDGGGPPRLLKKCSVGAMDTWDSEVKAKLFYELVGRSGSSARNYPDIVNAMLCGASLLLADPHIRRVSNPSAARHMIVLSSGRCESSIMQIAGLCDWLDERGVQCRVFSNSRHNPGFRSLHVCPSQLHASHLQEFVKTVFSGGSPPPDPTAPTEGDADRQPQDPEKWGQDSFQGRNYIQPSEANSEDCVYCNARFGRDKSSHEQNSPKPEPEKEKDADADLQDIVGKLMSRAKYDGQKKWRGLEKNFNH